VSERSERANERAPSPRSGAFELRSDGGLARWAPKVTPPIGVDLTEPQVLTLIEARMSHGHRH